MPGEINRERRLVPEKLPVVAEAEMHGDCSILPFDSGEAQPAGRRGRPREATIKFSMPFVVEPAGERSRLPSRDVLLEELIEVRENLAGDAAFADLDRSRPLERSLMAPKALLADRCFRCTFQLKVEDRRLHFTLLIEIEVQAPSGLPKTLARARVLRNQIKPEAGEILGVVARHREQGVKRFWTGNVSDEIQAVRSA